MKKLGRFYVQASKNGAWVGVSFFWLKASFAVAVDLFGFTFEIGRL